MGLKPDDLGFHTPFWPDLNRRNNKPKRTICSWRDDKSILTEHAEILECETLAQFEQAIYDNHALVVCECLATHPYLPEMVESDDWSVLCSNEGVAQLARHNGKRGRTSWVIEATTWAAADSSLHNVVLMLRRTFDLCHAGDFLSPAALGQALMLKNYKEASGIHPRPHTWCQDDLRRNMVGGRVDNIRPGEKFPEIIEHDINGAYLHKAQKLPTGAAIMAGYQDFDNVRYVTGFWHVNIIIKP